jgi:hypothetical protein
MRYAQAALRGLLHVRARAASATLNSSSGGRQRAGRRLGERTDTIVAYEHSVRYTSSTVHLIGRGEAKFDRLTSWTSLQHDTAQIRRSRLLYFIGRPVCSLQIVVHKGSTRIYWTGKSDF